MCTGFKRRWFLCPPNLVYSVSLVRSTLRTVGYKIITPPPGKRSEKCWIVNSSAINCPKILLKFGSLMQYWMRLQYRRPRNGWSLLLVKSKMVDWTATMRSPMQSNINININMTVQRYATSKKIHSWLHLVPPAAHVKERQVVREIGTTVYVNSPWHFAKFRSSHPRQITDNSAVDI